MSNFLWSHGLQPPRFLCPWNAPGKNTEVGCYFFLQGIFNTQGWNLGLLHCRQILYHLSHWGSPQAMLCCSNTQPLLFFLSFKTVKIYFSLTQNSLVGWHELGLISSQSGMHTCHLEQSCRPQLRNTAWGITPQLFRLATRRDHLSHLTSQTRAWLLGDQEVRKRLERWRTLRITEAVLSFFLPLFPSFPPFLPSFFLIQVMYFTLDIIFLHWT